MPGDHRQRASLAHDRDGLLADGHVVPPLRVKTTHDAQLGEGLVQQRAVPPVQAPAHDIVEEDHRPGGGADVSRRVPPALGRRDPQDEVGEGQVRQELPVAEQQMQPLRIRGVQVSLLSKHVVQGWHIAERSPIPYPASVCPGQMVADPLRMTPRRMRSATESAEIPGRSSR